MTLQFAPASAAPPPTAASGRRRFDPFEVAILVLFAAVSVWTLGLDLWQVIAHGRVWTGTDGFFIVDQLQYLAWIADASHHLLVSNLFVLHPTPSDYFQPAVAISGGISALGVPTWLSLLLWKPVAVLATFLAVRAYARASVEGVWSRRAVLALGLFFGSFTVVYGNFGVLGDLFPAFLSWGYTFGLMAMAAMLAALVAYDTARRERRRLAKWPLILGLTAGLLHPWQGELLILVVAGSELVIWWGGAGLWGRRTALWQDPALARRVLTLPVAMIAACAVPLAYYAILGKTDMSWGLARVASKHGFSLWSILLDLAPLAIPAALGYRHRAEGFLAVASRVWPGAALVIYFVSASGVSATPLHAFEGVTVPLAVLAVQGVRSPRLRRIPRRRLVAALALLLATVPSTAYEMAVAHQYMGPQSGNPNFILRDERDALTFLARHPAKGGVLSRFYLGVLVPGRTGRHTFVGDCLWSEPGCQTRAYQVQQLFDGKLSRAAARSFVVRTGARFALADCTAPFDLRQELGGGVTLLRRFGCAAVYEIEIPPDREPDPDA